jgi:hypothetical protein
MERGFFSEFWHTCPSKPGFLKATELKDPTPAPPDIGAIEEKLRPPGHTTSRPGKKPWPLLIALPNQNILRNIY